MEHHFKEITPLAVDLEFRGSAWSMNPDPSKDHLFPLEKELIRFGISCDLGFFRTLHLVVKNQWEAYVVQEKRQSPENEADYPDCLEKFEEKALARLLDGFRLGLSGRPDAREIYLLFEEQGGMASGLGYDLRRFSALIDQMVLSRVHYRGNASPELEAFVAGQERERSLLAEAGREQEYEFWLKKCSWLAIQSELEDKLLLREDIRLRNFNVTLQWMALFGTIYLELLEARMRCLELERRIGLKRAEPSLSEAEIDKRVKESIEDELASIEKVRADALQVAFLDLPGSEGEPMSDAALERYREEAKKIMREIWRLTHPDALDRAFTERQRERLREYLERVVQIRKEEALYDVRALSVLKDILARVREIYDVMGIDLEPHSVIRGDTLAQQVAWLETEIQKIERQIEELRAEIQAMTLDPDIREKTASMAGEETRKETMLVLEQCRRELEEKGADLQAQYQCLVSAQVEVVVKDDVR